MILDQSAGAIQQLATTAGLNVWTWSGVSDVIAIGTWSLAAAQVLVDGATSAQTRVDGSAISQVLVDGAVAAQSEPN